MLKDMAARLNRYRFRSRVVIAYIILSLFTTVTLSITIYQILANNVMERIGENSLLSLQQSTYAADTLYEQINTVRSQMFVDIYLKNFIYARTEDKVATYEASLALAKLESVYPFIQSIELYNPRSGVYFNTLRPNINEQPVFAENARNLYKQLNYQRLFIFPRRIDIIKGVVPTSYQVLSFVFRPSSTIENNSMVILNLDLKYITDNIQSYSEPDSGDQTFMLDDNNVVIAHSQPDMFLKDLSGDNYLQYFTGGRKEGYLTKIIGKEKYLISFTESSVYQWYFVSIKPYKSIIGGLASTRNVVLVSSIATFLIALVISILIMRNIYNPFQRLLDRMGGVPARSSDIEILTKTISRGLWYQKSHEARCQELFLHELLFGMQNAALDEETRSMMYQRFNAGSYCVMVFKLDNIAVLESSSGPQLTAMLQFNISNVISEVLSHHCTCVCAAIGTDEVAALCSAPIIASLQTDFREILDVTRSLFNVSISSYIGNIVYSLEDVKLSYASACKQMRFRIFEGHGCCLDEVSIQPYLNNDASYPYEIEAYILRSIQTNNSKALESSLNCFGEVLKAASCDNVHHYALQLAYSLLRYADSVACIKTDSYDRIFKITGLDTVDDISCQLKLYVNDLINSLQNVRLTRSNLKHVKIIDEIKNYITENYMNPNLSLDSLSEIINLSPEYIRKLFKQMEGNSFSHFLTDTRLKKACELLANTDSSAMQIGEQVGLLNTTYFFTMFKKAYGMTPTAYREQERKKLRADGKAGIHSHKHLKEEPINK